MAGALALAGILILPMSGQAQDFQSLQTTSWTQLSQRFMGDETAGSIQITGLFDTPSYPPEDRGVGTVPTTAQSGSTLQYEDGIYLIKEDYIYSWGENTWRILTGPIRYDQDDWINVAITLGVTGSLFLVDEAANDFWQDDVKDDSLDDVLDIVNEFGDFQNITFGSVGAYAAAELLGAKREKAAALMVLETVVLTTLLTESIKIATGRERPKDATSAIDFNGITDDSSEDSFPSGHASNAFAVATVMSEVYGDDNPWVPWVAYPLAGGVGLARINKEKHFLSDIFFGGALGFFIGKMVTRYNPFLEENGLEIQPFSQQGAQGISVAYKF